jgi:CheY-like chemotaxis protein
LKPSPPNHSEAKPPRCARILHAEDDALVARFVASFLAAKGHQIETVTNGRDALARVIAQPGFYDVLIADHSMPELTGLECVRVLRKRGFPGKIIVFASPLSTDVEKEFLAAGVNRILHKSSDLTSLGDAIQDFLSASAAANETEQFLPPHKQDAPASSAEASVESGAGEQQPNRQDKL